MVIFNCFFFVLLLFLFTWWMSKQIVHNGFFFLSMYFVYYINLVHRLQMTNRQIYWIFDVRFLVEKNNQKKIWTRWFNEIYLLVGVTAYYLIGNYDWNKEEIATIVIFDCRLLQISPWTKKLYGINWLRQNRG